MLVYKAQIMVPDNATYYDIQEAQLRAEWKFEGEKLTPEERWQNTDLCSKCGSCKHFIPKEIYRSKSWGDCERGRKNRARSSKACKQYERRADS